MSKVTLPAAQVPRGAHLHTPHGTFTVTRSTTTARAVVLRTACRQSLAFEADRPVQVTLPHTPAAAARGA
ncbi:hypothetical protein [Deinococcus seoulensis]|nr:hypothetical protein [Deinococcus seoulensis]